MPAEFLERRQCVNCGAKELAELSRGKFSDQPLSGFIEADPWDESPVLHLRNAEWILVRCVACGQVFHKRILTDAWNERRFSKWMGAAAIQEFEARLAADSPLGERKFARARDQVAHIIRIEKQTRPIRARGEPVRLLDFGCGWGDFVTLCERFGFEAYGVDRSAPRAAASDAHIAPSFDDLPHGLTFHAVTLFEVLEHVDEPAAVLSRAHKILVPNGVLVLETPDCTGVTGIQTHEDYRKIHPLEHINAFTNRTLTSIAVRCGFAAIPQRVAHVTADRERMLRLEAKHFLRRDGRSTRLYFRKT